MVTIYTFFSDGGGGGGTPLYKLYRYVPPQREWFLSSFGLKTGIDFDHYGLKSGMVFKGTTGAYKRICLFDSKWIVEKEKYPKCIIQAEYYQLLTSLLMRTLITVKQRSENGFGFLRPGLKTGVENGMFWSEIGSGFGEPGGTPLPKIPRSTPPPPGFDATDSYIGWEGGGRGVKATVC